MKHLNPVSSNLQQLKSQLAAREVSLVARHTTTNMTLNLQAPSLLTILGPICAAEVKTKWGRTAPLARLRFQWASSAIASRLRRTMLDQARSRGGPARANQKARPCPT